ncbi:thioesterase II family protein [Kitasatospora cineracea]
MADLVPLVCFAPAGAGASFFAPWGAAAERAGFALTAIDLPGRERRFAEPPVHSVPAAAEHLHPEVSALLAGPGGGVLLGHCLGAWVAYHLARLLSRAPQPPRLLLCASGSAAPGTVLGRRATGLPDDAFLRTVEHNTGFVHPAFQDEELRELLLPALRADVEAAESYRPDWPGRTPFPVLAWRARADRLVPASEAAAWQRTAGSFAGLTEYPGDHMSLPEHGPALLPALARTWHSLSPVPATAASVEHPC